jgi:ATP-dependent RNA helicase DDX31/DBP7
MADSEMLVNFSTAEEAPVNQPKFKGGPWKERLVAKRVATYRQQRRAQSKLENGGESIIKKDNDPSQRQKESDFPLPRPVKRRREDGDFAPSSNQAHAPTQSTAARERPHSLSQSGSVISSLFSYNPKPVTPLLQPSGPTTSITAQASNAPLVDGVDTFISLGLSNVLANHLVTKLELKHPTAIQKSSISQLLQEDSDAFIQSETGSGKTLAYLLPLLQRMMSLSAVKAGAEKRLRINSSVHRDSGLFAIILAPTRELCKQISVVLERLLGCAHWLVAGTVIGGEKKKSEKARLRKGLNILVATPGRLADHLENTKVLDIGNVRWLVLDEGDRLVDLGFEDEIQKIVKKLDEGQRQGVVSGLPQKRTTVLCSATMKMNVQRLGEISLKDAALIKPDAASEETHPDPVPQSGSTFYAPAQLKQSYSVVPAKLRLATLTALLKRTFARKGSVMKAIVFLSCADSVDFHYDVFTRPLTQIEEDHASNHDSSKPQTPSVSDIPGAPSAHLCSFHPANSQPLTVYKLHGSLPQPIRTSILRTFSTSSTPSLLLATDVASRGLDLPNLDLVIEYDPPFSSDDHLHRIGRTARLGRDGRAIVFLLPGSEEGYVEVLKSAYHPSTSSEGATGSVTHTSCTDILKRGFSPPIAATVPGVASNWEAQATSFQLDVERWVLSKARNAEMAKRAFQSHVRAYATHVSGERKYFDIKQLHLGHLAKGFGLRDAPGRINVQGMRSGGGRDQKRRVGGGGSSSGVVESAKDRYKRRDGAEGGKAKQADENEAAAQKMRKKMRDMGTWGSNAGAGEFNIA